MMTNNMRQYDYMTMRNRRAKALAMRQEKAFKKRMRMITMIVSLFIIICITIVSNLFITSATQGKDLVKQYMSVTVSANETLTEIAREYFTDGYSNVNELLNEIIFINGIEDANHIVEDTLLMVPYYKEQ